MMSSLRVTVDPTAEPISLEEAKDFLRVDSSDEDALILSLITAAREYCETKTNRHFVERTVVMYLDEWPSGDTLAMPRPFQSTTASPTVNYYVEGSTSATAFASTNYWVDKENEPGRIVLRSEKTWPDTVLRSANAVEVTMKTGYGSDVDVPDSVKAAMRLLIGHWYEHREAVVTGTIVTPLRSGVDALLAPHMVPYIA